MRALGQILGKGAAFFCIFESINIYAEIITGAIKSLAVQTIPGIITAIIFTISFALMGFILYKTIKIVLQTIKEKTQEWHKQ